VDDAFFVGGLTGLGDLLGQRERLIDWDRAAGEPLRERLTFDELQHQVPVAVGLFEPVNAADVRVIQRSEHLGLMLEAGEAIGIGGEIGGQDLDGDLPVEFGIGREIHHAHAAPAEFTQDLEWTNGGWVHERGVYGSEGSLCPSRHFRGQQTACAGLLHPNAFREKFYWCSVTPTLFRVKPFDEHIEGLSRCGNKA